jgi:hypothetical protein
MQNLFRKSYFIQKLFSISENVKNHKYNHSTSTGITLSTWSGEGRVAVPPNGNLVKSLGPSGGKFVIF